MRYFSNGVCFGSSPVVSVRRKYLVSLAAISKNSSSPRLILPCLRTKSTAAKPDLCSSAPAVGRGDCDCSSVVIGFPEELLPTSALFLPEEGPPEEDFSSSMIT
jgi:hypothetical protein